MSVNCNKCGRTLSDDYAPIPRKPCPTCGAITRNIQAQLNVELEVHDSVHATMSSNVVLGALPDFLLKAGIVSGSVETSDGLLVESVGHAWWKILEILKRDPSAAYQFTPRQWEEIIAGAYEELGFDEVILTPRSADHGRDVIASKHGVGSIRIYDQVKAYKPGNPVSANDVRAMLGILDGNVSKGVITTTSTFAPRLLDDPVIARHVPYRLELKDNGILLPWLDGLRKK